MAALIRRLGRCVSRLPHTAALVIAEYERAMLAASRYERLRGCYPAERGQQGASCGIARAVFEAHYR
jgi:hypothetical protein